MKHAAIVFGFVLLFQLLSADVFAAGPAFSGLTANADTAETVVTNPAGMTRLKKPSFYGNPMVMYTNSETRVSAEGNGRVQEISNESWIFLPGVYYSRPLDDRWTIGIGPYGAAGLGTTYDDNWAGRYLLKEWSLTFFGVAPSVAYQVTDKLSFGASVPLMYSRFTLEKAVFNLDTSAEDGSFELKADGQGVGINFGILYELNEFTRFGLVYRSAVSVTEEGKPEFSGLTPERQALLERAGALNRNISIDTGTPQAVTAGIFHDFQNRWSVSLDMIWLDFSEWGIKDIAIGDDEISTQPTNYKDIWGATLGLNYRLTPQWTARSGVFYLSSALDDQDRTAFMRLDQMWGVGFGGEYTYKSGRSLALDLTYIQFGDGSFDVADVPRVGTIEGEYTTNYALAFSLGSKF